MAFTPGNDTNIVQATDSDVISAGLGDDIYILAPSQLAANQQVSISDADGANTLKLVGGLSIESSKVANDTAQLTLSNGAVVTITGASSFNFNVGGTALTGGVEKDYATFAQETLGVTVPAAGEPLAEGGASNINADGSSDVEQPEVPNPGEVYDLTAANAGEIFAGTDGDDVYTATSGSLNGTTIDAKGGNDTLNATLKNADNNVAPTLRNVENVDLTLDVFDGANATFNANGVRGATITLGSEKLGYNGVAEVDNAGDNNVTAGTNVETLNVAGLKAGVVDAGQADAVDVDAVANAAGDSAITLTVNGDLNANVDLAGAANSETLNLDAAAASVVTLDAASTIAPANFTLNGTGDLSVDTEAANVTGATVNGVDVLNITDTTGDVNAENFTVNTIEVSAANGGTVNNANGQVVELSAADATALFTVSGDGTAGASTTVNVTANQAAGNGIAVTGVSTSTINLSAAVTNIATSLTVEGESTINVAGDVTIADLAATTAASDSVVLTGTGNVTVTTTDLQTIDASGLQGELNIVANTATGEQSIVGGTGDSDVTLVDQDSSFTGQGGDDTVDAQAATSATVAVATGAGNDTIELAGASNATVAFNGGEGEDTVWLASSTNLTSANVTLQGVEQIEIENQAVNTADTTGVTVNGSLLSGEAYSITSAEAADTVTLNVTADEATTDLGGLTLSNVDSVEITGQATAETIVGTNADDTIAAGGGADVLTGGAGADTFEFAAGNSTEAEMASITDFNTSEFDVLDLVNATVGTNVNGIDVSAADADGTATTINASVTDGIVTLSGADAAAIDTLEEWVDVVETAGVLSDGGSPAAATGALAFEFDGNTYVYEATGGATDNIVELTGVTGLSSVDTTPGAGSLVIA